MEGPKFQVFRSIINQQYYLRLKSGSGEVILGSEGYFTQEGYREAISEIKSHSLNDTLYDRRDDSSYTFYLRSSNGEIIGRSEQYHTRQGREKGIQFVKQVAANAPVEDLT